MGFDVFPDSLGEHLSGIKIGDEGFVALISNENKYIYSKDTEVIGKDVEVIPGFDSDFKQKAISDYTGTYRYCYGSTQYDSVFKICETTGWLAICNIWSVKLMPQGTS